MSVGRIPISRPLFGAEELEAIQKPLLSGWVVQGPFVQDFERKFATFIKAAHATATTSCTTALHLAVAALGLKAGEEVIVPAFTWISTANVIEYMGARPVFCDIDLATFNMDVDHAASLVSPRTVGLLPVHLFGLCADMAAVTGVAGRRSLWVVEDAACAFGAEVGDRHAGTFGEFGCFSFHPRKALTTGEGGMVTTMRPDLDRVVRSLRDHGASRTDFERHAGTAAFLLSEYGQLGYNYRMTDIQGALGSAQMDRAVPILEERRRLARRYDDQLADIPWLQTPIVPDGYSHGYQSYVCLFRPEHPTIENLDRLHLQRNRLMARLEACGIATRQGTHAPVLTSYYASKYGFTAEQFPSSAIAEKLSISLPLFPGLSDAEQDRVCEALRRGPDA
jgi:dTDP-4-amino-4,6-dideoxygalactose transaminase